MLVDALCLTLFQLAFGLVVFNLLTPSANLSGGFFALHGILALPCLVLAALASGRSGLLFRPSTWLPAAGLVFGIALASLALHTILANAGYVTAARGALLPGALAMFVHLTSRATAMPFLGRGLSPGWLAAGLVLGGLLFGAVVWAMNLGHWYLVSKSLPFQLLVRGTLAFAALAVLRAGFAIVSLRVLSYPSFGPAGEAMASLLDPTRDGLFFWSRVLWGLAAPLALAPFVVKTARMKSNQAATGLLYVALVFVMIGELLATYLSLRSGLPV